MFDDIRAKSLINNDVRKKYQQLGITLKHEARINLNGKKRLGKM